MHVSDDVLALIMEHDQRNMPHATWASSAAGTPPGLLTHDPLKVPVIGRVVLLVVALNKYVKMVPFLRGDQRVAA